MFLQLANVIKAKHHVHDYWLNMSIDSHGMSACVGCLKVVDTQAPFCILDCPFNESH